MFSTLKHLKRAGLTFQYSTLITVRLLNPLSLEFRLYEFNFKAQPPQNQTLAHIFTFEVVLKFNIDLKS